MTRYSGNVGYATPTNPVRGVWSDSIVERPYFGDILTEVKSSAESDKVNSDVRLQERISIVGDAFAFENFTAIKYASRMGVLWTVQAVNVEHPRLILSLGGVYHGTVPTIEPPDTP